MQDTPRKEERKRRKEAVTINGVDITISSASIKKKPSKNSEIDPISLDQIEKNAEAFIAALNKKYSK